MFCFFFFYMYTEEETYDRMADKVIQAYDNKGTSGIINPYYINGLSVKILQYVSIASGIIGIIKMLF